MLTNVQETTDIFYEVTLNTKNEKWEGMQREKRSKRKKDHQTIVLFQWHSHWYDHRQVMKEK